MQQHDYTKCSPLEVMPGDLISDEFIVEQLRSENPLTLRFSSMKHVKINTNAHHDIYWVVMNKSQIDFFTVIIMLFCSVTQMSYYFKMTRSDSLCLMQRANQE